MQNRGGWVATGALVTMLCASALSCSGQIRADATDGGAATGDESGPCFADGSCSGDLSCVSQTCVSSDDDNPNQNPDFDATVPDYDGSIDFPDAGTGPDPTTLYGRLGGRAGIAVLVKESVEGTGGAVTDPQIASYFFIRTGGFGDNQGGTSTNGGAPDLAVVEDCFTQFLARAAGGPEVYPFTSHAGGASFACRDMATAHSGLGITSAAFQKFVSIIASKYAAAGVSQADLQTLGGALLGTASDIIDRQRIARQQEAGVDAYSNYGALCESISGGSGTAPGCTSP